MYFPFIHPDSLNCLNTCNYKKKKKLLILRGAKTKTYAFKELHCNRTCSMDFLKTLATIFSRILIKQVSALKKTQKHMYMYPLQIKCIVYFISILVYLIVNKMSY